MDVYEKLRSASPDFRAQVWLQLGERGISSNTICYVLSRLHTLELDKYFPDGARWLGDPPKDPSDFRRCHLLLTLIPEWRSRLNEVSERYPAWSKMVANWDELTALYNEESKRKDGMAHKLYAKMQELLRG